MEFRRRRLKRHLFTPSLLKTESPATGDCHCASATISTVIVDGSYYVFDLTLYALGNKGSVCVGSIVFHQESAN
ncbi:hypothetical protein EYF80_026555 [Liparis tanakae]|uniref:Uncharacterized protein n=1 Tax=Liparis tanakae TaxID=230148 RepID=A0A4Z2HEK3_9TELE|nr:hypothetical protein EYF80_026555 [Liparis tanakae]